MNEVVAAEVHALAKLAEVCLIRARHSVNLDEIHRRKQQADKALDAACRITGIQRTSITGPVCRACR